MDAETNEELHAFFNTITRSDFDSEFAKNQQWDVFYKRHQALLASNESYRKTFNEYARIKAPVDKIGDKFVQHVKGLGAPGALLAVLEVIAAAPVMIPVDFALTLPHRKLARFYSDLKP